MLLIAKPVVWVVVKELALVAVKVLAIPVVIIRNGCSSILSVYFYLILFFAYE